MYFESRTQAGTVLADALHEQYRYENCAVVALNDGGVVVGEQIAARLHCVLTMLVIEQIDVPGESMTFGGVSQTGQFTLNGAFSYGEQQEYTSEYHGLLEEQKREAYGRVNRLVGEGGLIDTKLLFDRTIILVIDGFDSGISLDVAADFLKPVRIQKLVIAAPVASLASVDRLHLMADELHILDVRENYMGVDHYYEDNTMPSHEETIEKINRIILSWS